MARSLRFSLLGLLLVTGAAAADLVYRDGDGDAIRLFDKESPCPVEIVSRAPEGDRGYYRLAEVTIAGVKMRACAAAALRRDMPGVPFVHVMVEGRGSDLFLLSEFKQEQQHRRAPATSI